MTYTLKRPNNQPWPGPVKSYTWEYKRAARLPCVASGWIAFTDNNKASIKFITPMQGQYDVKCTIVYQSVMGNPAPPDEVPPTTTTIPDPTSVKPYSGFGVATEFETGRTISYRIHCGAVASGGNTGTAQEKISDVMEYYDPDDENNGVAVPTSGLWLPPTAGPDFSLQGPLIVDVTTNPPGAFPDFAGVPVDRVFLKWKQELRLVITCQTSNGITTVPYPLGTVALRKRKVSATEYVVEQGPRTMNC